ncbi:hypothetical protein MMC16_000159 [Acarospora aff. strigata]|nr:hypothetical protein [Acarospora aff. strigata]
MSALGSQDRAGDGTTTANPPELMVRRQRSHPALSPSLFAKKILRSKSTTSPEKLHNVPASPSCEMAAILPISRDALITSNQAARSTRSRESPTDHEKFITARIASYSRHKAKRLQKEAEKKARRERQHGQSYASSPTSKHAPYSLPREDSTIPRQASITRLRQAEKPKLLSHSKTFPVLPDQRYGEVQIPMGFSTMTRGRGASMSSQGLRQRGTPAPLVRPSTAKPDYGPRGPLVAERRERLPFRKDTGNPHDSECVPKGIEKALSHTSDNIREVRASVLSALTSSSSFFDASGTERSSVVTKSSSVSDSAHEISYESGTKDEDFSVDDAISMYAAGFCDDDQLEGENQETAHDCDEHVKSGEIAQVVDDDTEDEKCVSRPAPDKTPILTASGSGNSPPHDLPLDLPTVMASTERRDRYGFHKATQHVTLKQYDAWDEGYSECLKRRKPKWLVLMKEHGLATDAPSRFPPRSTKVKRFVRKGIPPEWRGAAWFWYAGGYPLLQKNSGLYECLVEKANNGGMGGNDAELIERDLHRTFPDNIRYKPDPDPSSKSTEAPNTTQDGQSAAPETPVLHCLRRVLRAFSIYNPRIGYCQSLNFLAGLLLLFMQEEKAFWMLVIITTVYLPGTHEVSLEGANVDLWVLMTSIKESMPTIWTKIAGDLDGTAVTVNRLPPITLCTTAWFMSCFIGTLPIETVLRVWDAFFYEGSKTLFRVALAIFKVGEQEIKAVNDPMEIFQVVQTIPRRLIDASQLMDVCFRRRNGIAHLRQETIEERRRERRQVYADERARVAAGGEGDEARAVVSRGEGSFRQAFRRVRTDSNLKLKKMQNKMSGETVSRI